MAERLRSGEVPAPGAPPPREPWYRRPATVVLVVLATLFAVQMVTTALRTQLTDEREVIALLRQGVTTEQREEVRSTCGAIEGIEVVEDRGTPEQVRRFGARFSVAGTTRAQERDLYRCLGELEVVQGVETDNTP